MDYAGLFSSVAASLESGQRFSIQVQTTRDGSVPDTRWEVYVPLAHGDCILVEGANADEVWRRFNAELNDEAEMLEETSAAIGEAEVG